MFRRALLLLCTTLALGAQDPVLKDTLTQAKAAWGTKGDRDGAATQFTQVIEALAPAAATLDPGWVQVLCEAYNWMAVLDDRLPANRPRVPRHLEALLDLNPDFDIDRTLTSTRLQNQFDTLRAAKLCKVKLTIEPAGGVLLVDGKARPAASATRYLPPGSHAVAYAKPGYQAMEQHFDLAPKEAKALDLKLVRTSSAITVYASPVGAEILLDGKSLGFTRGQAGPDLQLYADKAGVRLDQLSAGFVLTDLAAGKHLMEVRLPCHKTRRLEIGETFTTPFADHDLEPVKLEPSRAFLTLLTTAPGGEVFLGGKSYGPAPVKDLAVCAERQDLQVRFPSGSFSQTLELKEGQALTLTVRPKPRLTYAGFEGAEEFAGRPRLTAMLTALGARLTQVAFATAAKDESPQDCITRLRAAKDTELLLWARALPGKPVHQVELILATLTGEEERLLIKPLESDPLGALAARLETPLALTEPWAGLTLLDVPGTGGPWVLQADPTALKAGIKVQKPILQVNGKALATVQEVRKAIQEATAKITVNQGEGPVALPVSAQALELPVNSPALCYPQVLAELRLRYLGAAGDEAGLLRLNQALALMHFREFDKALEVLRDARVTRVQGVSQGTLDYYTGVCLLRMGNAYLSEALQAFNQALKYPQATLFGPEGPLLAPMARQALEDNKP